MKNKIVYFFYMPTTYYFELRKSPWHRRRFRIRNIRRKHKYKIYAKHFSKYFWDADRSFQGKKFKYITSPSQYHYFNKNSYGGYAFTAYNPAFSYQRLADIQTVQNEYFALNYLTILYSNFFNFFVFRWRNTKKLKINYEDKTQFIKKPKYMNKDYEFGPNDVTLYYAKEVLTEMVFARKIHFESLGQKLFVNISYMDFYESKFMHSFPIDNDRYLIPRAYRFKSSIFSKLSQTHYWQYAKTLHFTSTGQRTYRHAKKRVLRGHLSEYFVQQFLILGILLVNIILPILLCLIFFFFYIIFFIIFYFLF